MDTSSWTIIVLSFILIPFLLNLVIEFLDLKNHGVELPEEVNDVYDNEEYIRSLKYHRETSYFGLIMGFVSLLILMVVIFLGGFAKLDEIATSFVDTDSEIIRGLAFASLFFAISHVLSVPANLYSTFVIEEKYGFNKTTFKTWVIDQFKGLLLAIVIGLPLLALLIYIFQLAYSMNYAWLYAWLLMVGFQVVMMYLSPLLMSLFNKFEELKDLELKKMIESYAVEHKFSLSGIFQMDGSKRSSKANAFFAGFGKFRKIVLFDTLIEKLNYDELLVVLAHEMGHFKCKHIMKLMIFGFVSMGGMLFLLQQLIHCDPLYEVFSMQKSVYASLIIISSIILSPLSMVLGIFKNYFSRKYEYEADAYAVKTTGNGQGMIDALKKLSQSNLSNLTPHPLKTFFEYSHPTIVERIRAIKQI